LTLPAGLSVTVTLRIVESAQAIADPIRRRLLELVRDRELAAGELARAFPVSRPAVSRHLRVLREAGLLRERRQGRNRLYRADPAPLEELRAWLDGYWAGRLEALKAAAEDDAR
jgi:DNA-binding transcriptional ArsR family regulator